MQLLQVKVGSADPSNNSDLDVSISARSAYVVLCPQKRYLMIRILKVFRKVTGDAYKIRIGYFATILTVMV